MTTTLFGAARRPFVDVARLPAGDLLPIIPPDAVLTDGSHVAPGMRGKVPGDYAAGKKQWRGLTGTWAAEPVDNEFVKRSASWPTSNVGLRAAGFPAIDIDVASEKVRDAIENLATEYLGPAPVRVRDGAPRSLLVYRHMGQEPVTKMHFKFQLDGQTHAVDILGSGQQYLVAGTHPSGSVYRYRDGYDLTTWGADGLARVSANDIRSFFRALVALAVELGGTTVTQHVASVSGEGTLTTDLDPSVDLELAVNALKAIPMNADALSTREDIVAILASLRAGLGREAQAAYPFVVEWALSGGWADEEYVDKIWRSVERSKVGADYLLKYARKQGWVGGAKADFGGLPVDDATMSSADVDERAAGLEDAARQLVYWPSEQRWIVTGTGEMLSHPALSNHSIGMKVAPAGTSGVKSAPAKLRNSGMVRDVVGTTYSPGSPSVMEWTWEGRQGLWFNQYRAGPGSRHTAVSEAQIRPWLDHFEWLFPKAEERTTLLKWMAHIVQKPGVKIRWAPVLVSGQGLGKDLLLKPLHHGLGVQNVKEISPYHLLDKWTDYFEAQLIVVQEMLRLDKTEVYERVKAQITGTGAGIVLVEKKFQPAYPVPNKAAFCFLTNNVDAFSIAADDRRFYVVSCAPTERNTSEYYRAIDAWYNEGGLELVFAYLSKLDTTGLNVDNAPAWTSAKELMLEETMSPFSAWVRSEFLDERGRFHGRTVITNKEIERAVETDGAVPRKVRDGYHTKLVAQAMRSIGFYRPEDPVRLADGSRQRLWCASTTKGFTLEQMRARHAGEHAGAKSDFQDLPSQAA